ncbi:BgTH12-01304 [Blumeria graminis f. sp. triticale]|uniref:BgTH12-01304 n=2 Tax=Blumeria graminis TaxID=34373 RepID=A0A9W4DCB9_BLUGR|nr:BgTH12-01304 [Blumeria graminis f. sp. triticale]
MVKADYSRDYYNDLELNKNSDIAEIKKQYKKLALVYHPDRNIGKSNLDAAKFQRIQSAYEVLIDPLERARYDVNHRFDSSRNTSSSHTGYGQRGNPWSNVGKTYPPPPKPPTARNRPAPFATDGTRRYENFKPPQQSAYQATQEGAQARKATYEAWENTRSQQESNKTDPGMKKNNGIPTPPPRSNRQPGREERSYNQSKNSIPQRKNGFMPSTPGGDELPAPKGAYSTLNDKSRPPVPPRNPENDPLQSFSSKINLEPSLEPRVSTPYATHGGERFDPFNHKKDASDCSRSSNGSRKESPIKAPHLPPRLNTETRPPMPQNKSPSKEDSNTKPFLPSATDSIRKPDPINPRAARKFLEIERLSNHRANTC